MKPDKHASWILRYTGTATVECGGLSVPDKLPHARNHIRNLGPDTLVSPGQQLYITSPGCVSPGWTWGGWEWGWRWRWGRSEWRLYACGGEAVELPPVYVCNGVEHSSAGVDCVWEESPQSPFLPHSQQVSHQHNECSHHLLPVPQVATTVQQFTFLCMR